MTGGYPGFYAPYASRLERIDRCFGVFISDLKAQGMCDDSVILLTSDHGDSLGENGAWGHQFFLYPEDIRIPLMLSLPQPERPRVTTDLERATFSTDIAPTLSSLLGHEVRDLGPLFGSPLFVRSADALHARRRQSFLVMSSYGSSYGLLRRNGRQLYALDLFNWREYAYELFQHPLGTRVKVRDALRRVNQTQMGERVAEVDRFYGIEQ